MQQDMEKGSYRNPIWEDPIVSPSYAMFVLDGEKMPSPRLPVMKCSISIGSFSKESLSVNYVPGLLLALGTEWLAKQPPSYFCLQLSVCWMRQTLDPKGCHLGVSNCRR